MVVVLNVAEKPTVAKEASRVLSGGGASSRRGPSQYNPLWMFQYNVNGAGHSNMVFTSVTGHLMEIDFEGPARKWHGCQPVELFDQRIVKRVPDSKWNLKEQLEREAKNAHWLVLWLDCDREGENISFEVVDVCRAANPRLVIKRAKFSSLNPQELHHAMAHLGTPNLNESLAVDARQEVDLRAGAAFTRFMTLLLQNRFDFPGREEGDKVLISYGPCQFPTLGFIVERAWEISNFVEEDFWSIQVKHTPEPGKTADFVWQRGRLYDHPMAALLFEACVEEPMMTVISTQGRQVNKWPPVPLNTVEMQKRASRFLNIGSEQVMKFAEELYQAGFISYPRTETDKFSQSFDLQATVGDLSSDARYAAYVQRLLGGGLFKWPAEGGHDDEAHPPIYPVKPCPQGTGGVDGQKARLYDFIVRHFLACCSLPAVGFETTVAADLAGETFTARGLMVKERNYLDIYTFDRWGGNANLPVYENGAEFEPTELNLHTGRTQPPGYLTESQLIDLMDKKGIGTDATMHDHIAKQQERKYAIKEADNTFRPTELGESLIAAYRRMGVEGLWRPALRAQVERDMDEVAKGRLPQSEMLEGAINARAWSRARGARARRG